jgi:carbon monoxide dehydrogenase subunit G
MSIQGTATIKESVFLSSHLHRMVVNVPIHKVWKFVHSMDHWAPLVPGYIEHEILNEKESIWKFKSDLGIMKKKVHLKVEITDWLEPEKVTFMLVGLNEKFIGNGYFEAKMLTKHKTSMTGYLDIIAEGKLAKIVNPILKSNIPEMTEEFTIAVGQKIEAIAEEIN